MQEISPAPFWKQFAAYNFELLLSLGVRRAFYQLKWPHSLSQSQILCRRPQGRQNNDGPRSKDAWVFSATAKAAGAALKKRLRVTVMGRSLGRGKELSTAGRRKPRTWELPWHQHTVLLPCTGTFLLIGEAWPKRTSVCLGTRSLFTSHPPKVGCFHKSNPWHSIQAEHTWTTLAQRCDALPCMFSERG